MLQGPSMSRGCRAPGPRAPGPRAPGQGCRRARSRSFQPQEGAAAAPETGLPQSLGPRAVPGQALSNWRPSLDSTPLHQPEGGGCGAGDPRASPLTLTHPCWPHSSTWPGPSSAPREHDHSRPSHTQSLCCTGGRWGPAEPAEPPPCPPEPRPPPASDSYCLCRWGTWCSVPPEQAPHPV